MKYVFVKIGGSFITYKSKPVSLNYSALVALKEIFRKVLDQGDLKIVAGNGGGSFAHYAVMKYNATSSNLLLVKCQEATRLLNRIVVDYLVESGIPATSVQTSVIVQYDENRGEFEVFYKPIETLLEAGIVPVVYGECVLKAGKPVVVSTEKVFELLAKRIKPSRVVLLTDVDGIYTCDPKTCPHAVLIEKITPHNISEVLKMLMQYRNADATGGVFGKVQSMSKLAMELGVEVLITSGFDVDSAVSAILGRYPDRRYTLITSL
ncbi:MAG: isopentenyl phosphate kinase [Desulfurococcaceae archaeon]